MPLEMIDVNSKKTTGVGIGLLATSWEFWDMIYWYINCQTPFAKRTHPFNTTPYSACQTPGISLWPFWRSQLNLSKFKFPPTREEKGHFGSLVFDVESEWISFIQNQAS